MRTHTQSTKSTADAQKLKKSAVILLVICAMASVGAWIDRSKNAEIPIVKKMSMSTNPDGRGHGMSARESTSDETNLGKIPLEEEEESNKMSALQCAKELERVLNGLDVSSSGFLSLLNAFRHAKVFDRDAIVTHADAVRLAPTGKYDWLARDLRKENEMANAGNTLLLLYPTKLVVQADAPSCAVESVFIPSTDGDYHPKIRSVVMSDSVIRVAQDTDLRDLALKFAPVLYFDNDMQQFPMNAQGYISHDASLGQIETSFYMEQQEFVNKKIENSATYYMVASCGTQIRIIYYWFYGYQPICIALAKTLVQTACRDLEPILKSAGLDPERCGYHKGDWEHVMVTLSTDRKEIAAVTYWAHGDPMTRVSSNYPRTPDGRPIAYIGKRGHGSFPESEQRGGVIPGDQCSFFADYRNNNGVSHQLNIANSPHNLFLMDFNAPPPGQTWMSNPNFCKNLASNPCEISSKPQLISKSSTDIANEFCNVKMCKNSDACSVTSCLSHQTARANGQCESWLDGSMTSIQQVVPIQDDGLLPKVPSDGTTFRCSTDNRAYFQMLGEKRFITDLTVHSNLFASTAISTSLRQEYCNNIPSGPDLRSSVSRLVQCGGYKFLQTTATRKTWICDDATVTAFGLKAASFVTLSSSECRRICNDRMLCQNPVNFESQLAAVDAATSCTPHAVMVPTVIHQRDRGSGADQDLVIWKASIPASVAACVPIATQATTGGGGQQVPCLFGAEGEDYARPTHYSKVWVDWGSGNHNDYSLWMPLCPTGFVSLSGTPWLDVYGGNHAVNLPFQGVYCVASKYAVATGIAHRIWSDAGTGASQDGSAWAVSGGYWAVSPNHGAPPGSFYKLAQNVVVARSCILFTSFNIIGNDLRSEIRNDVGACQTWCANDDSCFAFTYDGNSKRCYIKSSISHGFEARPAIITSGAYLPALLENCPKNERWNHYDLRDHDIVGDIPAFSFQQCKTVCLHRSACRFFTWNRQRNLCWLKSGNGGLVAQSVAESGSCR